MRRGRRCLGGPDWKRKACGKDSVAGTVSKVRVEKRGSGSSMRASSKLGKVWTSRKCFCKCGKCGSYGYGMNQGGGFQNQTIGNPDGYQNKGLGERQNGSLSKQRG